MISQNRVETPVGVGGAFDGFFAAGGAERLVSPNLPA